MPLDTSVTLSVAASLTKASDISTTSTVPLSYLKKIRLRTGTAAGQADKLWFDQRTLTASATEDLDLTGTLTDEFGATFTIARVKGIVVCAAAGNTNNVIVGNATSNAWAGLLSATGTVTLRPGAVFAAFAGDADATCYAVTGGTGDLLKVANSAGTTSVTYQIVVIAASA